MIKNRTSAGKQLGKKLFEVVKESNSIVLAIPRGGVVVGLEIANMLNTTLDVIISKKITPPANPEYAIGAITHDGTVYVGPNWKSYSNEPNFDEELNKKKTEVKRRIEEYRGDANYQLNNKTVILVDDGIATGSTVFVILKWLLKLKTKRIILAVPVIPAHTYEEMSKLVDTIVALQIPIDFSAVGQFYEEFNQVSDEEVLTILSKFKNQSSNDI